MTAREENSSFIFLLYSPPLLKQFIQTPLHPNHCFIRSILSGMWQYHNMILYFRGTKSVYSNFKLIPLISKERLDKNSFLEIISYENVLV